MMTAMLIAAAALAIPATAAAADYETGDYFGTTSQGGDMIMTVSEGKIERYGFELKLTCKGRRRKTSSGRYTNRLGVSIGADGRFVSRKGRKGLKPVLKGRISGTTASGTFRFTLSQNGETCKSPLVKWSAEPR